MSDVPEVSYRLRRGWEQWRVDALCAEAIAFVGFVQPWSLVATVPAGVLLIVRRHTWRLTVRPHEIVTRRTLRSQYLSMASVRSLEWSVLRRNFMTDSRGRPALSESEVEELEMFVHRHAPEVEIRSQSVARAEARHRDPATRLAAVRMANVRRWRVRIRPVVGGFRAEATALYGPAGRRTGPIRSSTDRATEDGLAMMQEFEHEQ